MKKFSVLFVCYGNICRSPSAHGVFRSKLVGSTVADIVTVDSAATHDLHPGDAPDPRSRRHALNRGYDISDLRARQVTAADAEDFDLILVMEQQNLEALKLVWPHSHWRKVRVVTDFCSTYKVDHIPDPYYGGPSDFELVLDILEDATTGILQYVEQALR